VNQFSSTQVMMKLPNTSVPPLLIVFSGFVAFRLLNSRFPRKRRTLKPFAGIKANDNFTSMHSFHRDNKNASWNKEKIHLNLKGN